MGEITKGQIREWLDREARGDFGDKGGDDFQWFVDNWKTVRCLRSGDLVFVKAGTAEQIVETAVTPSDWQRLFGHLRVWDSNFNESNFPLGIDPGDEAEEFGFDRVVTGHEALAEFERIKRQSASLWAQGRYIKANPQAQKVHPLIGIGAQWQGRSGSVYFPVFFWDDGEPAVGLGSLGNEFSLRCRFLLRKGI